jgi:uncharacterized membrane protein YadS
VPWFVLGILLLIGLRSPGVTPHAALEPSDAAAKLLAVISVTALALGVNMRADGRLTGGVLSLLVPACVSVGLIYLLQIA